MSSRRFAAASCLVAAWVACACLGRTDAGEAAKEPAIKKGDKVRVINGPAPIKASGSDKTLITVETGTVLEALDVKGDWVKAKARKEGWVYTGWIKASKHLEAVPPDRAVEVEPVPKKQPPPTEGPPHTQNPGELPAKTQSVDMVTFIKAFAAGEEGRYKGYLVEGGGACSEMQVGADEAGGYALVLVCGKRPDGSFYSIRKTLDGKGKTRDQYNFDGNRDRIFSVKLVFEKGKTPKGAGATGLLLLRGSFFDRFVGRFQGDCSDAWLNQSGGPRQKVRMPVLLWEERAN